MAMFRQLRNCERALTKRYSACYCAHEDKGLNHARSISAHSPDDLFVHETWGTEHGCCLLCFRNHRLGQSTEEVLIKTLISASIKKATFSDPTRSLPSSEPFIDSTAGPTAYGRKLFSIISRPDANDSRMQQVMYANGKLWGALDTALNPDNGPHRAGLAWYILNPAVGKVVLQGYLGATGFDFTYPAIGVTSSGRGVVAFTATGDTLNPSAGFAPIDAIVGVGPWNVINGGTGAAQDDGFTSYKSQVGNPPPTRWGDYGAAAVDGSSVWIASEYIANACVYTDWGGPFFLGGTGDNLLGTCGGANHGPGVRSALGNWSTRISQLVP